MIDRFQAAVGTRRGHTGSAAVHVPARDELIARVVADSEFIPGVFSNPGTGNVRIYGDSVTFRDAAANIAALIGDVGSQLHLVSADEVADKSGRYPFVLAREDGSEIAVEMPGLPLKLVRYQQGEVKAWLSRACMLTAQAGGGRTRSTSCEPSSPVRSDGRGRSHNPGR